MTTVAQRLAHAFRAPAVTSSDIFSAAGSSRMSVLNVDVSRHLYRGETIVYEKLLNTLNQLLK